MPELTANSQRNISKGQSVWEYSSDPLTAGNSDFIILPDGAGQIEKWNASIIGSGVAKVQFSTSKRAAIIAGTANWQDWNSGDVIINASTTFNKPNGVRAVVTSGTWILEVTA